MTVLHLEMVRFLLPDDFKGSLADSLRLLADYLDLNKRKLIPSTSTEQDMWVDFYQVLRDGGRVNGIFGLNQWNEEKKEWDSLPFNTGAGN